MSACALSSACLLLPYWVKSPNKIARALERACVSAGPGGLRFFGFRACPFHTPPTHWFWNFSVLQCSLRELVHNAGSQQSGVKASNVFLTSSPETFFGFRQ